MAKATDAFRTIGEVSDELDVPKHVLRFWEGKFPQLKPMKRGGGRRFYRPEDVALLRGIHHLLHAAGYTIKGVQRILREDGVDAVKNAADGHPASSSAAPATVAPSAKGTATNKRDKPDAAAGLPMSDPLRAQIAELVAELRACLIIARGLPAPAKSEPLPRTANKAKR